MDNKILTSGIYKITNLINGKFYIGSTNCFKKRLNQHFKELDKNIHGNNYLQNAWNKYGEKSFKFEVLARCPKEYLIKLEQWFLDNMKPEYNICKIAGSILGIKNSDKTKLKKKMRWVNSNKLKISDGNVLEIIGLLNEGESITSIANKFKVSLTSISDIKHGKCRKEFNHLIKNKNKNFNKVNIKDRKSPKSKLNDEKVLLIIKDIEEKISIKEITQKYDVSTRVVTGIKRKETWKHITQKN